MLLLVINCIIWPPDAEGWQCKCFVVTLGLSFLFFFLSRSCHPATLEGRDHPSDYLIRLEPHWHLQAADRSVISGIRQETLRLTVAPLSLPLQGLGGVPGSQAMLPSGMDPTRQQGKHCECKMVQKAFSHTSDMRRLCSSNRGTVTSSVFWCFFLMKSDARDLLPIPLANQLTCMAISFFWLLEYFNAPKHLSFFLFPHSLCQPPLLILHWPACKNINNTFYLKSAFWATQGHLTEVNIKMERPNTRNRQ